MLNQKLNKFRIILSFTFILFLTVACNNRPEGVINQQKMILLLTDLHKLDGALSAKGWDSSGDRKSIYYYNSLFEKFGITKAEFDSSLVWYSKNPKKFEKIYTRVYSKLQLEDSILTIKIHELEDSAMNAVKKIDIWNKNRKYILNSDSSLTATNFEIKGVDLYPHDIYELNFIQRINPSDSSLNQHAVLRIHYTDSVTDSVFTITHNDSILRHYKLRLVGRYNQKIERLTGTLHGKNQLKGKQNTLIDSISLTREYSPVIQKELQFLFEQNKSNGKKIDVRKVRLPHMPKSNSLLEW